MGNVRETVRSPLGVVAVMATIAIVASGVLALTQDDHYGLPMPDPSGVAPALIDGEPVWVVDSETGLVVISAVSTHGAENVELAWCPSSRTFKDLTSGSEWDEYGRNIWGPAPRDLDVWTQSEIDGEVMWTKIESVGRSSGIHAGAPCSLTDGFASFVRYEVDRDWTSVLLGVSSLVLLLAIGGLLFRGSNRDAAPSR